MTQQPSKWARPSPTIRVGVLGLLAAFLLVLPLALAPRAEAFIYWTERRRHDRPRQPRRHGCRAPHQRSGPPLRHRGRRRAHLLDELRSGGRSAAPKLDGTGVEPSFIPWVGEARLRSVAVDAGHLYWSSYSCPGGPPQRCTGAIARANLDGTGVDRTFIDAVNARGLAVDTNFLYWTDLYTEPGIPNPPVPDTIGRANLDGTGVNTNFFTPPSTSPTDHLYALAVDSSHIYWIRGGGGIGRANLNGTPVSQSFISVYPALDVAVDASHVYWSAERLRPRAPLASAAPTSTAPALPRPSSTPSPDSVAVDALTDTRLAGKASAKRTQRQKGRKLLVKAKVKAEEELTAKARGKIKVNPTYKLKPKTVELATGETKTLKLKPKKSKAKKIAAALKRGEKAKAKLSVKLTDRAGNRETEKLRVRLKR